jgi:hypothetical protein
VARCAERDVTATSCSITDIQAAVNQVKADGGTVRVPAGEAEAVGTIVLPGGVSLVGAGMDQTKLFRGPATDMMAGGTVISADGANGRPIRISGVNLVGFLDQVSAGWDNGISVRNATTFAFTIAASSASAPPELASAASVVAS